MNQNALKELSAAIGHWRAPVIGGDIPHGDMPGDKVQIGPDHIAKANTIFPLLVPMAAQMAVNGRVVITVCGGSGVGKSEIACLDADLESFGFAVTVSGNASGKETYRFTQG